MEDGFYHGIGKLKKPATKVMAPPGGDTHINVFETPTPDPAPPINKCQEERSRSTVFAGPPEEGQEKKRANAPQQQELPSQSSKPSTRVINPPGGRTSVSIGGPGLSGNDAPNAASPAYKTSSPFATSSDPPPKAAPAPRQAVTTQSRGNPLIGGDGVAMGGSRAKQPPGGASHGIF